MESATRFHDFLFGKSENAWKNFWKAFSYALVVMIVTGFIISGIGEAASSGKKSYSSSKSKVKQPTQKVKLLLDKFLKAKTYGELGDAYKAAKLSKNEESQFEQMVKKNPYAAKIKNLVSQEKKKETAQKKKSKHGKKTVVSQKQKHKIKQKSAKAKRVFRKAKPTVKKKLDMASLPPGLNARTANADSFLPGPAKTGPPSKKSNSPIIKNISPIPMRTGQNISINGKYFGTEQGDVEMAFKIPNVAIQIPVSRWADKQVVASIPNDVEVLAAVNTDPVVIWVVLPGTGNKKAGKLARLESSAVPEIISLSSYAISPGQQITILGNNFREERPGRVQFVIGSHRFNGIFQDGNWSDHAILVKIPDDIKGISERSGSIEVLNYLGLKDTYPFTFYPLLETITIYDVFSHRWMLGLLGPSRHQTMDFRIMSDYRGELQNDWLLRSAETEVTSGDGSCRYCSPPEINRNRIPGCVEITANKRYDTIRCTSTIVIEGPAGTNPAP